MRCPTPHSGVERSSRVPAMPWVTPSASPIPMSCTTHRAPARASGETILTRIVTHGRITLDPPGIEVAMGDIYSA
jgi:hypothetical protein